MQCAIIAELIPDLWRTRRSVSCLCYNMSLVTCWDCLRLFSHCFYSRIYCFEVEVMMTTLSIRQTRAVIRSADVLRVVTHAETSRRLQFMHLPYTQLCSCQSFHASCINQPFLVHGERPYGFVAMSAKVRINSSREEQHQMWWATAVKAECSFVNVVRPSWRLRCELSSIDAVVYMSALRLIDDVQFYPWSVVMSTISWSAWSTIMWSLCICISSS